MSMSPTALVSLSLAVAVVVFALKMWAYTVTNSAALYSDALESVVNIVAAMAALIAIHVARQPADKNHPYGHTKAEYLSAVLEGVLVSLAAIAIVIEAAKKLWDPAPVQEPLAGLGISAVATLINAVLAAKLISYGRKLRSPALMAEGKHVRSDVVSSVGVLGGIALAWSTGWWILDPLLALAVAGNVLLEGWRLVRESVSGLMDEAASPEELEQIRSTLAQTLHLWALEGQVLEVHDLRTRRAGPSTFIEFHLVVPANMTVQQAHGICDRLEAVLLQVIPGSITTVHVEPSQKAKHSTFQIS
jgi:cation diffusion facilitator family transporter